MKAVSFIFKTFLNRNYALVKINELNYIHNYSILKQFNKLKPRYNSGKFYFPFTIKDTSIFIIVRFKLQSPSLHRSTHNQRAQEDFQKQPIKQNKKNCFKIFHTISTDQSTKIKFKPNDIANLIPPPRSTTPLHPLIQEPRKREFKDHVLFHPGCFDSIGKRWFRVSRQYSFHIRWTMQRGGTEINNLQFPPRHYRGTRQADCEHDAVCSAAAAAGSTGHDGSGNDSLPSPHNQSPPS